MPSIKSVIKCRNKATFGLLLSAVLSVVLLSTSTALHFLHHGSLPEFCIATLAIIPISALIRFSTKDVILRFQLSEKEFLTGLTSAILGNCTELSFTVVALVRQETLVAQTALTGAVLSNSLLILGICFLLGGLQNYSQTYPVVVARTNSQLLVVSLASIVIPTVFKFCSDTGEAGLQAISQAAAIVLLLVFACHLCFFYYTHSDFMTESPRSIATAFAKTSSVAMLVGQPTLKEWGSLKDLRNASLKNKSPRLPLFVNALILIISITMMSFASIYVLEAIEAPNAAIGLSKSFIGLIIIPVITGSAEHIGAALRSYKNRKEEDMNNEKTIGWIIDIAIVSSIRIALFVLPLIVIIGWALGIPSMTMLFDGFQLMMLCIAIFLVNCIMQTGCAYWLEGVMLISSFILFANGAWHYPNEA